MRRPRNANGSLQEVHIAVLGMNGCGKSALTVKYITRRYITEYDPNLEDTYCKHEVIHGHEYMIWIMDTVEGPNKDPNRCISWADIFIVMYDITSCQSFQYAEKILRNISKHEHSLCLRPHSISLVGNKSDLEIYRQVSHADGARLAEDFSAGFFEINCTEEYASVKKLFHHAITSAITRRMRAVERSPSPRMYSSDSEVPSSSSVQPRSQSAVDSPLSSSAGSTVQPQQQASPPKASSVTRGFRRSKSPKHTDSLKHQLPPLPHKKSSTGLKLFKLFQ